MWLVLVSPEWGDLLAPVNQGRAGGRDYWWWPWCFDSPDRFVALNSWRENVRILGLRVSCGYIDWPVYPYPCATTPHRRHEHSVRKTRLCSKWHESDPNRLPRVQSCHVLSRVSSHCSAVEGGWLLVVSFKFCFLCVCSPNVSVFHGVLRDLLRCRHFRGFVWYVKIEEKSCYASLLRNAGERGHAATPSH